MKYSFQMGLGDGVFRGYQCYCCNTGFFSSVYSTLIGPLLVHVYLQMGNTHVRWTAFFTLLVIRWGFACTSAKQLSFVENINTIRRWNLMDV